MWMQRPRRNTARGNANLGLAFAARLMAGTALAGLALVVPQGPGAFAQAAGAARAFTIPAQPLVSALNAFGRQSGLQITLASSTSRGVTSHPVQGTYTPQQALTQMLSGSGIPFRITPDRTVIVGNPASTGAADLGAPVGADGSLVLDTINVNGVGAAERPFETPAPVAHISQQSIERFRGSSPADIFRGTPGVLSGESRNGAGGIDVNIRGMQGMGRVNVTVDGAENGVSVYQGYQGASNRTFVDPDLLADIDIRKGSDVASRGIAGSVSMRTLGAEDILKPGETWGVRVKGGFGSNTATPVPGEVAGYKWPSSPSAPPVATGSSDTMDRPGFFVPTSGSGSIVAAARNENYDLLWGYAVRKQGNYFAGTNGPAANPVDTGPRKICSSPTWCQNWPNYLVNTGLTNYRAGEEVLNTQLETHSWIAKALIRLENDQTLQLGYTGYAGEAGDRLASRFIGDRSQATQQAQTAGTNLHTGTIRYRWNPADNDYVNLSANLWLTQLEMLNPIRGGGIPRPGDVGLGENFRTGSDSRMWGGDMSNTSKWANSLGAFDFNYGVSYLNESTAPSAYTDMLEGWLNLRDGSRQEAAIYGKLAYKPVDWMTLNAGLRYTQFWSEDRRTVANSEHYLSKEPSKSDGGFSPSIGVTVEPWTGVQLYTTYSSALRYPSLMEAVSAFTLIVNEDLEPERANTWELGVNVVQNNVFTGGDTGMMKFSYFNWDIENYIAREYRSFTDPGGFTWTGMQIYNIDRARFSGLEFTGRYELNGFAAELAANYYLDVEFCRTSATCESKSLYGDYATNHVPPEYTVSLTLSQKLFEDALTVGGRVSYTGPRAIGHGPVTAQGASQFIDQIKWDPFWLVDVFAEYKLNDSWTAMVRVENLTDAYYVDPLSLVNQPSPGRTFYASLTGRFGSEEPWNLPSFGRKAPSASGAASSGTDWTGLYVGAHGGFGVAELNGTTTALNGLANDVASTESVNRRFRDLLFGGQIGYNYQFDNRIVLGVQADYSRTQIKGTQDALAMEGDLWTKGYLQASTHYEFDWMATLRGRVGYAFDNLLIYASGGLSMLNERQMRDQYRSDSADRWSPYGNQTNPFFVESAQSNRTGWSLGAGAEWAITNNWSLSADYSFSRYAAKDFRFNNARAGVSRDYTSTTATIIGYEEYEWFPGYLFPIYEYTYTQHPGTSGKAIGRKASNAIDLNTLKIGLNYRF